MVGIIPKLLQDLMKNFLGFEKSDIDGKNHHTKELDCREQFFLFVQIRDMTQANLVGFT